MEKLAYNAISLLSSIAEHLGIKLRQIWGFAWFECYMAVFMFYKAEKAD